MNYDEYCRENLKRSNEEVLLWNLFDSISELKLKRVPIQAKNINDHEHTEIKPKTSYLLCYDGRWFVSELKRMYHDNGWEFYSGFGRPLAGVSMIYEILNLPNIPKTLIDRVEDYDSEEEDS